MTVFVAPHRLPQTKAYRAGDRPPGRRGSLFFSVSVPFHCDVFHPKSVQLGGRPEEGGTGGPTGEWGEGGRIKTERQLELISWGLAKKEAQALGNPLPPVPPTLPSPSFLSVCVTQGLSPLEAAPSSRRCRCPTNREAPRGGEMCFQLRGASC